MKAINFLIPLSTGDLIIECDSDDYFTDNAFEEIEKGYKQCQKRTDLYALAFLKYDQKGENMGNNFPESIDTSTMFDLYFKQRIHGEKALVFFADIRKQYQYELEKEERFSTEARMFHKMDEHYKVKCYNIPIMICEYQEKGYTKNINTIFRHNPYGYFSYFKEILKRDLKGITFSKYWYILKHYILFSYLTKEKHPIKQIKGGKNKIMVFLFYIPGIILTRHRFGKGE